MILSELVRLYDRLAEDDAEGLPPYGWSIEKVSFAIMITRAGEFVGLADLRAADGKSVRPQRIQVPAHATRAAGILPFFLCDSSTYLLGLDSKGKPDRTRECFEQAATLHQRLAEGSPVDSPLAAVAAFFSRWDPKMADGSPYIEEVLQGGFLVFQLQGEDVFVHEVAESRQAWEAELERRDADVVTAQCLVSGAEAPIERTHPFLKGVRGAQSSGAAVVSFNFKAAEFFGKEQGANAPISKASAFRYATVLNRLIASQTNSVYLDDTTIVFWADAPTPFDTVFGFTLGGAVDQDREDEIASSLRAMRDGRIPPEIDSSTAFYVLGLGPNASRVVVRFWLRGTIGQFAQNVGQHLRDVDVEKQFKNAPDHIPLWLMVRESRRRYVGKGKDQKGIDPDPHPGLARDLLRAVLYGGPYPQLLLTGALGRVRADGEINRPRIAAIKGVLARKLRTQNKEVPVALDEHYANVGYQLGRLFAALEKAQRDALGDINASIKDRYFGAASATPRRVFPLLIRLSQHHIAKAEWGRVADQRIEQIMQNIEEFPVILALEDQGFFALGYYHQRNALYVKKETTKETTDE